MNRRTGILAIALAAAGAAASAFGQIGVPGVPLPRVPTPTLPGVTDPVAGTLRTANSTLTEARKLRVRELLRVERATTEADPRGQPILRRQVGALSPTPEAVARAEAAGFRVLRRDALDALGLMLVVFEAPDKMSTRRALAKLRELDPAGEYDYNHLYLGSGDEAEASPAPPDAEPLPPVPAGARIGLIDSGVDLAHPVLAGAAFRLHGCDGESFPAPHGTAVASLLVGTGEGFESVLPGATVYAADIFCGHGGGALSRLAVELDWMAREQVAVVNISLVGAKSVLLTGLVRAMTSRGFLLVAAVGNDGPTAPPLYPASYPDVIGVTGVDAERRVLPEACRGEQVDFAATGAGVSAAAVGGGFEEIRGTSFATPIVAGLLARRLQTPDPAAARAAVDALAATAIDIGNNGVDPSYGKGLVGAAMHPGHRE
jgi:subtilisin family serine protease